MWLDGCFFFFFFVGGGGGEGGNSPLRQYFSLYWAEAQTLCVNIVKECK